MREITDALPFGTREILPAARFPDDVMHALQGVHRIYPRVLHFSGHGLPHGLLVENSEGRPQIFETDHFVDEMEKVVSLCSELLEGVLLMNCHGEQTAKKLHAKIPALTVIYWEREVNDKAAICFGKGFYNFLSQHPKGSLRDAYSMGKQAFHDAGFVLKNPEFWVDPADDKIKPVEPADGIYGILPDK